jgi:hypothetical protein
MTTASAQKADTVKNSFIPTGIRIGFDAVTWVKSIVQDDFKGYEFNADIDFHRYFLTMDVGHWERMFKSSSDEYDSEGHYMRIGIDINFLKKDEEKNMFFFGTRYGWSTFSDRITLNVIDPVWGTQQVSFANNNIKAGWIELTTGLRVKMYKFFWMGYTARYKFGLNTKGDKILSPADIPGYGRTDKNSTWGFNYQLLFRIPIKKSR